VELFGAVFLIALQQLKTAMVVVLQRFL